MRKPAMSILPVKFILFLPDRRDLPWHDAGERGIKPGILAHGECRRRCLAAVD